MNKQVTGIDLLKKNLDKVEEKFMTFFQQHEPRWPSETRDYMRNHHQSLTRFTPSNVTLEKLQFTDFPEEILEQIGLAFEAFKRSEEYT
ncbi:MAG TPA: hypothetical protein VL547_21285 [Dinghuibacter sp.]|jgi:hypothetical protein|uniref:hypothetical protein n=1 Tax=Dinghuibacter sp. TaxID=2024697 RepID=UPI002CA25CED|nr:hypothetical protein [Dinghuibacter sp.]HTJ14593.1 hypothetical protein [Dinghuibacter sp.]